MEDKKYGMGWQRDLPDFRDFTPQHEKIRKLFHKSKALKPPKAGIRKSVDLTKWCSPVENQGTIGVTSPTRRAQNSRHQSRDQDPGLPRSNEVVKNEAVNPIVGG